MNKTIKSVAVTTVILTVICAVSAALLGVTNFLTADRIAKLNSEAKISAMKRVVDAKIFETKKVYYGGDGYDYYVAKSEGGNTVGYVFTVKQNGYGGPVEVMTGVTPDGVISAIEVLDASGETPGLGQKATDSKFWKLFQGKSGKLEASKSASADGQIEAMTGATVTSKAVVNAVNKSLELFETVKGEVK